MSPLSPSFVISSLALQSVFPVFPCTALIQFLAWLHLAFALITPVNTITELNKRNTATVTKTVQYLIELLIAAISRLLVSGIYMDSLDETWRHRVLENFQYS